MITKLHSFIYTEINDIIIHIFYTSDKKNSSKNVVSFVELWTVG